MRILRCLALTVLVACAPALQAATVAVPEDEPVLTLQVPEDWVANPGAITYMRPKDETRNYSFSASVIDGKPSDLASALSAFFAQVQALGKLTEFQQEKARPIKTGDFPGMVSLVTAKDPKGNVLKMEARSVEVSEGVFYVMFAGGAAAAFDAHTVVHRAIMDSAVKVVDEDAAEE